MNKYCIANAFVLAGLTISSLACYFTRQVAVEDSEQIVSPQRVYKIQTTDDAIISFESDSLGYAFLRDTTLERRSGNGSVEMIPLSKVKVLYTTEPNPARTLTSIALGIGLAYVLLSSLTHMGAGPH